MNIEIRTIETSDEAIIARQNEDERARLDHLAEAQAACYGARREAYEAFMNRALAGMARRDRRRNIDDNERTLAGRIAEALVAATYIGNGQFDTNLDSILLESMSDAQTFLLAALAFCQSEDQQSYMAGARLIHLGIFLPGVTERMLDYLIDDALPALGLPDRLVWLWEYDGRAPQKNGVNKFMAKRLNLAATCELEAQLPGAMNALASSVFKVEHPARFNDRYGRLGNNNLLFRQARLLERMTNAIQSGSPLPIEPLIAIGTGRSDWTGADYRTEKDDHTILHNIDPIGQPVAFQWNSIRDVVHCFDFIAQAYGIDPRRDDAHNLVPVVILAPHGGNRNFAPDIATRITIQDIIRRQHVLRLARTFGMRVLALFSCEAAYPNGIGQRITSVIPDIYVLGACVDSAVTNFGISGQSDNDPTLNMQYYDTEAIVYKNGEYVHPGIGWKIDGVDIPLRGSEMRAQLKPLMSEFLFERLNRHREAQADERNTA